MTENLTQEKQASWVSRWVRRALVAAVLVATTVGAFYTIENWRGKRAWEECKRELESRGYGFDWKALIPPPVPDESNFFKAPMMSNWFCGRGAKISSNIQDCFEAPVLVAEIVVTNQEVIDGQRIPRLDDSDAGSNAVARILRGAGPALWDPLQHQKLAVFNRSVEDFQPVKFVVYSGPKTNLALYLHSFVSPLETDWACILGVQVTNRTYRLTRDLPLDARVILKGLERCDPDLDLIRSALRRPFARLNGNYEDAAEMPIPNFAGLRSTAQLLSRKAKCHMLLGEGGQALRDVTLLNEIRRICKREPTGKPITLVDAMINVAITGLYVDTLADGFRLNVWREPDLVELQNQLASINVIPGLANAFQSGEGVSMIRVFEKYTPLQILSFGNPGPRFRARLMTYMPQGWQYQNMVVFARWSEQAQLMFEPTKTEIDPAKVKSVQAYLQGIVEHSTGPYNYLVTLAIPNTWRAMTSCAKTQTQVNQACIVCGLERYRLAKGRYPEALDKLVPEFAAKIPVDVIKGQPMHYRCGSDGATFSLYSVGWDEKDDGGEPKTDWVWSCPPAL